MNEAEWTTVEDALAQGDPDRFVSTFFAPSTRRRALIALYAFDHEVSRIGAVAQEPMAGHIRLAWWREQIGAIYSGGVLDAPVGRALAEACRAHDLPQATFERYLDARALDLEEVPFQDEAALLRHAAGVSAALFGLAVRVLGVGERADNAAHEAGLASAMAGHLREFHRFAARRRCRVPVSWMDAAGLNAEDLFAATGATPALRQALTPFCVLARTALVKINRMTFPRAAMPALAPATMARWPIGSRFKPLQPDPMSSWQRVARLSLANLLWRV